MSMDPCQKPTMGLTPLVEALGLAVTVLLAALLPCDAAEPAERGAARSPAAHVKVLRLWLRDALFRGSEQKAGSPDLLVDLEQTADNWGPVFGIARDYCMGAHHGRVLSGKVTDNEVELKIVMTITGDSWIKGGSAEYALKATAQQNGDVEGAYEGQFNGAAVKGHVVGTLRLPRPLDPNFVPVSPGEHPRILFRKRDLPALREKLKTPFGQAALKLMTTPIGLGVKYQLLAEKQYAEEAMQETKAVLGGKNYPWHGNSGFTPMRPSGYRWEQVAVAYDLCCDAWPDEFKQEVRIYLLKNTYFALFKPFRLKMTNWNVFSNHVGIVYAAAALAGMALWGEPVSSPFQPAPASAQTDATAADSDALPPEVWSNLYRFGRLYMYVHYREATGTGGFQAEVAHYHLDSTDGPDRYATAHRQMFGYDVSPYPDMTHYIPRTLVAGNQDINGWSRVPPDYFSALFPVLPEQWKPAALTAWNVERKVTDAATRVNVPDRDGVQAFLSYPLDMKPGPLNVLPLVWEAPDYGFYAFRSSWEEHPFITQVFLKAHIIGGWNGPNAGTFRITGLGYDWACGVKGRERHRFEESVVQLPEDQISQGALGRLIHFQGEKDGSGTVSVDLNDIYSGTAGSQYSMYGNFRRPGGFKDLGIKGMRAFAVDYSGLSGAPCLFVVLDKIQGGKKKTWLWQTPVAPEKCAKTEEQGFTITQGDVALHGRFIVPTPVTLTAQSSTRETTAAMGGNRVLTPMNAVTAEGGDSFFFVCTIQRGAAPAIRVEGTGLEARVLVGQRVVAFDGQKVVFSTNEVRTTRP